MIPIENPPSVTPVPLPDREMVAENVKAWAAANPVLAALLNAGTPTAQALTQWSIQLLTAKQISEAKDALCAAVALNPRSPTLWTNYGAALTQANLPNEAVACFRHSLTLSSHQPETWMLLSLARRMQGDLIEAESACRKVLEQDPNSLAARQLLGLLRQDQKDYAGAVAHFSACVKVDSSNAELLANLGKLHYQLGQILEAYDAYRRAANLVPANLHFAKMTCKCGFLVALIRGQPIDTAIANFQKESPVPENGADQPLKDLLNSAFLQLSGFGYLEAAACVGRKQLELSPDDPLVTYLLKAVLADSQVERTTPEYVVKYFDSFANGFEAHLVNELGYDVPEKICSAVREIIGTGKLIDTLDAGCGTGLCGGLLRPVSRTLTGVDLSSKMLEHAGKKGIYDTLVCEDLINYLHRSPRQFDLIMAADVVIYFGDLSPLFAEAAGALRPGGLFAFSTESWTGAGYRLQPSGRFAQSPEYVRATAVPRFEELRYLTTTIRLNAGERVPGHIFIFRRRIDL